VSRRRGLERLLAAAVGVAAVLYVGLRERAPDAGPADSPAVAAQDAAAARSLRLGWTAWADAEWITHLVARILEERLGQPVSLVMADIGLQYQALSTGQLDAMLMAWLPVTHRDYYQKVAGDVIDLGPLYTRARLGWVVPDFVPRERLASLEDLRDPEVRERLGGRIQGIDPGSGLMRASRQALRTYGLRNWELVPASAAAMTAALDRAVRRNEWIVLTAWSPHWIFARYDLRYLEDPRGVLGQQESVHGLARAGFDQDFPPQVMGFLSRLFVPIEEVEKALLVASQQSVDAAVDDYLARHADRVDYWVTGEPCAQLGARRPTAAVAGSASASSGRTPAGRPRRRRTRR
jgi:glycine betaine/proline transport system substrate-binding protein